MKEGFDVCEEDVVNIVKAAANKLTKAGAIVEEMSIPMHADGESKALQIRMAIKKNWSNFSTKHMLWVHPKLFYK